LEVDAWKNNKQLHLEWRHSMSDIYKAPEAPLTDPSVASSDYGSLETALSGDYELRPIETVKEAWAGLKGFKTTFWLAGLVYMAIFVVVGLVLGGLSFLAADSSFAIVAAILEQLLSMLILGPLGAGFYMLAIKFSVGSRIEVGELFKYFHKTIPIFLMTLLMYVTVIIGFILLIVPGIYLLIAYSFAIPLMVEKNMGPWEALNTSRKILTHKWFNMFGFSFVVAGVMIVGTLALVVGLLWAIPLCALAFAYLYRDIVGVETSTISGAAKV